MQTEWVSVDPEYRAALLELFRAEDPARLIKLGAPDDEYEPEVDSVVGWTTGATQSRVSRLLHQWFGSWGSLSAADAERLADGILRLQLQYGVIQTPGDDEP